MNWTTYDFSPAPCLPCCTSSGCFLTMPTLLVDGTTDDYADITAATAAIASQAADGCLMEGTSRTRTAFTSVFTSGTLSLVSDFATSGADNTVVRVFLTAGDGLSIDYSADYPGPFGNGSFNIFLYADDQTTLVDSITGLPTPASGTWSPTISSDGYYYIYATGGSPPGGTTGSRSMDCTGGASLLPCAVRAGYDDGSGGTDYVICA